MNKLALIELSREPRDTPGGVIESTDRDATLDVSLWIEQHMPSDRGGLIMRRLLALFREHGEDEIRAGASAAPQLAGYA